MLAKSRLTCMSDDIVSESTGMSRQHGPPISHRLRFTHCPVQPPEPSRRSPTFPRNLHHPFIPLRVDILSPTPRPCRPRNIFALTDDPFSVYLAGCKRVERRDTSVGQIDPLAGPTCSERPRE